MTLIADVLTSEDVVLPSPPSHDQVFANGRLVQETIDGRVYTYVYNPQNKIKKITTNFGLIVDMEYDEKGKLTHYKDNQGTEWWKDINGKLVKKNGNFYLNHRRLKTKVKVLPSDLQIA